MAQPLTAETAGEAAGETAGEAAGDIAADTSAQSSHPHAGALPASRAWLLVGGATLTMAVSYFDRQTLTVLAPTVSGALGLSNEDFGWLVSAFAFAYLVGTPICGKLVDRFGARRVLLGAVVLWTLVAALHSLVWSFAVLAVLRVGLGLAESPSYPGSTQTIHRALPPERRARGFGFLFTGSSLGALTAPFAAGYLNAHYGWRVAFLVTAIAGLAWIPMWLWVTRGREVRAALDAPPAVVNAAPVGVRAILTHKAVVRVLLVVFTTSPLIGFVLFWSAKYLAAVEGVHQNDLGRYLWVAPILFDLGSIGFGHLSSRHSEEHGTTSRGLFLVCGLLACALPLVFVARGPWAAIVLAGCAIAGVAGLFVIFTADMLGKVPAGAVGMASSLVATAQSLAFVISSPLIGRLVDKTQSYAAPIVVLTLLVIPGVATYLLWRPATAPTPKAV
jgi:ACS family hexuronate transporter-like MFS transporter